MNVNIVLPTFHTEYKFLPAALFLVKIIYAPHNVS